MSVDKAEKEEPIAKDRLSRFMWEEEDSLEVVEEGKGKKLDLDELLSKPK